MEYSVGRLLLYGFSAEIAIKMQVCVSVSAQHRQLVEVNDNDMVASIIETCMHKVPCRALRCLKVKD